jgi:hypothetical protein
MIGYGTLLILIPKGTDVQYKRNRKCSGGRLGGPMPQHVMPLLGISTLGVIPSASIGQAARYSFCLKPEPNLNTMQYSTTV